MASNKVVRRDLSPWLQAMKQVWDELLDILADRDHFLGIDSSYGG